MVKQRELIRIKPVFVVIAICFLIVGMTIEIIMTKKRVSKYIEVTKYMKIDSITITGDEKYGLLNGAVFIKENYFVNTSAILIENPTHFDDWVGGAPIISFTSKPYRHTLWDLGLPYTIYKKANSDTLHIIKEGYLLKFLMRNE